MSRGGAARGERSPIHIAAGALALAVVAAIAVLVPSWGRLRHPAVVQAARVFSVASVEPGRYLCTLRDGREAGGSALVRQRVLEFERSDLVELEFDPALVSGAEVMAGQRVAVVRSLHHEHRLDQLRAERGALLAHRALLDAGGRPAEVEAAERRVAVSRAELEVARAELERARALAGSGLISDLELETSMREDRVLELEVEQALAEVEVARAAARPQAIQAVDAEVGVVDTSIAELERLVEERVVRSPISGVARVGSRGSELEIHAVDTVYLAIPIPEPERSRVVMGVAVRFSSEAVGGSVHLGEIVSTGDEPVVLGGCPMVWVSAEVDNSARRLTPGMTGVAELLDASDRPTLLTTLTAGLSGGS